MKSKEELEALRTEYESLNKKLNELTKEEREKVVGGSSQYVLGLCGYHVRLLSFGRCPDAGTYPICTSCQYIY